MIEKFNQKQIQQLIKELHGAGYNISRNKKEVLIVEEGDKLGLENLYVSSTVSSSIYNIADWATENYENKGNKTCRRKTVSNEIEKEYRRIVSGILKTLKPYYGRMGFCKNKRKEIE